MQCKEKLRYVENNYCIFMYCQHCLDTSLGLLTEQFDWIPSTSYQSVLSKYEQIFRSVLRTIDNLCLCRFSASEWRNVIGASDFSLHLYFPELPRIPREGS